MAHPRTLNGWYVIHDSPPGMHISDAARAVLDLAKELGRSETFRFNGKLLTVRDDDTVDEICERFHRSFRRVSR